MFFDHKRIQKSIPLTLSGMAKKKAIKLIIPRADKDTEQLEISFIAGRSVKCHNQVGK